VLYIDVSVFEKIFHFIVNGESNKSTKKIAKFTDQGVWFACESWGQFFLKFIVSHPAVTCAIPATSRVIHLKDNMGACYGRLPDENTRREMIKYMAGI
jgi:aryl-alcohol dehydrogenase-like predicted oxidoreductase